MRPGITITSSGRGRRHKKPVYRIERCRIYFVRWIGSGAAFTLPGIGIFVGKDIRRASLNLSAAYLNHLIMHEYGHILQAQDKGLFFYYGVIAPISLGSAFWSITTEMSARLFEKINPRISFNAYPHHNTWTEWDASRRAKLFFKKNIWQEKWFPTRKPMGNHNQ
ncbi:MAG TPA: hypothetical protein VFL76_01860 [Edaphocola sp.]|nr:hypothetical protein [Edaphocola sp.]